MKAATTNSFKPSRQAGVTLIELMIVVAIIGIIASIAYPSYQNYVIGSNRGAAQADLMALAAAMERHKAATFSYQAAAEAGANTGKPKVYFTHSPSSEPLADKRYDLLIETVSASGNSYLIKAKPVSSSQQKDDGELYLFSDGRKGWDKDKSGALSAGEYCWNC